MLRGFFHSAIAAAFLITSPVVAQMADGHLEISDLLESGDFDLARSELANRVAQRPDAALFAAHLEAMIQLRLGNADKAADILRQILDVAPDFEPARQELTVLLARLGQADGAIFHAQRLLRDTKDPVTARNMNNFVRVYQGGQQSGITGRFSILPSTNATRGTQEETIMIGGLPFTISPESRAREGIGFAIGSTAWKKWQLSEHWSGMLSAAIDFNGYLTKDPDSEQSLQLRYDFQRGDARTQLRLGPVAELASENWDPKRLRLGFDFGVLHLTSPRSRFRLDSTGTRQVHQVESFRDGYLFRSNLGFDHAFSNTLYGSLDLSFGRETTQRAHLDHHDNGLFIKLAKEWQNGLLTGLTVGRRRNDYVGNFPGTSIARRDVQNSIGVQLSHDSIKIWDNTPEINVTWIDSNSNVGFYDYTSLDVSFGFTTSF